MSIIYLGPSNQVGTPLVMAPDVVTRGNSTLAMFKRLMPTIESLIIDATTGPNQADSANYDRLWTLRLNSKEMRQVDELIGVLELINGMTMVFSSSTSGYVAAFAPWVIGSSWSQKIKEKVKEEYDQVSNWPPKRGKEYSYIRWHRTLMQVTVHPQLKTNDGPLTNRIY
ncbi:hypothetical protein BX616_001474 [Lobosporangium transversale]|nr:hypothetical protein BX616_001474 [Lobosporangium transversale]